MFKKQVSTMLGILIIVLLAGVVGASVFLLSKEYKKEVNCHNGNCIQFQQKYLDGALYNQDSLNKVDYKIGIVYISESDQTYNPNWRVDLYPYKKKIENALGDIFSKKDKIFVVDFLGDFMANDLCWNPSKIAFIQEKYRNPGSIEKGWKIQMPGSALAKNGDYSCLYTRRVTLWSDYDSTRMEEFKDPNHYEFPNVQCFKIKCDQRHYTLSLNNSSWIEHLLNNLKSADFDFSNYDYRVIVLGNAGPIIPQTGEKEKQFFDNVMTTGDVMGYYYDDGSSGGVIVMTENGLRIPSYYHSAGEDVTFTKIFMPGWQQVVHEILHSFGAVDVYEFDWVKNPNRIEALKLEPESEVDKSIMANGWSGYCNVYESVHLCTAQDTEKIYLDKFNRIKLDLE